MQPPEILKVNLRKQLFTVNKGGYWCWIAKWDSPQKQP